jgi:hypothetical protein
MFAPTLPPPLLLELLLVELPLLLPLELLLVELPLLLPLELLLVVLSLELPLVVAPPPQASISIDRTSGNDLTPGRRISMNGSYSAKAERPSLLPLGQPISHNVDMGIFRASGIPVDLSQNGDQKSKGPHCGPLPCRVAGTTLLAARSPERLRHHRRRSASRPVRRDRRVRADRPDSSGSR